MYMELILFAMISLIVIVALLASRLNDNSFPFPFDRKGAIFTPADGFKISSNYSGETVGYRHY